MSTSGDRNLLLGILAVQMDFVSREQLLAAMNAWVLEKARGLDAILFEQKALKRDAHELLVALVEKHLELHGGDAEKSLAAVSSIGSLRDELKSLGDDQIEATLPIVSKDHDSLDPHATETLAVVSSANGQRFRILRPHAKGGLGEVSVARDEEFNREVALKEIQERFADDPSSRGRFVFEAQVTGGLEHPGIVPVYGLGQYADGRPFYAMRFIRGDSLKEAVDRLYNNKGPMASSSYNTVEFRKLLGRFVDVCQAIEYAHSRGVLHRDLKPGNIMLGKYGETLVVDWGLAKAVGRDDRPSVLSEEPTLYPSSDSGSAPTQMGSAIGTPAYMSPEQAAGRLDDLGPASDVYSLGATLYYVLTGRAPIHGGDQGSTLRKVQAGDFPMPGEINSLTPKSLEAICRKAMALRPEDRYSSPQELAEDIELYLADEPIPAHVEPLPSRVRRWLRKHPKSVAAVTATLVIGLASAVAIVAIVSATNGELRIANENARKAKDQASAVAVQLGWSNEVLKEEIAARAKTEAELAKSNHRAVRSLVTALKFAPPERVQSSIRGLHEFREQVVPILRKEFLESKSTEKLQMAFGLAAFNEAPHDYLVEQLLTVPENQAVNVLLSLSSDVEGNRQRLVDAFGALPETGDPGQQARLAIMAIRFGDPQPAVSLLKAAPNPARRASLIDAFHIWFGIPEGEDRNSMTTNLPALLPILGSIDDVDFRSGMCLALGRFSKDRLEPRVRQPLVDLLEHWFRTNVDGGVHSAAGWALRRWGKDTSQFVIEADVAGERHWHVSSQLGLTMIRIPAGSFVRSDGGKAAEMKSFARVAMTAPQKVTITKAFLLADTEICWKDFRRFVADKPAILAALRRETLRQGPANNHSQMNRPPRQLDGASSVLRNVTPGDPDRHPTQSADAEFPVYDISWIHAAAFCNWASEKEDLIPVYRPDVNGHVQRNPQATGYRLPTEAEWEFACRAGATTVYVCGDETSYLDDYANRTDFLKSVGTFLPNRWGLFDVHGNVAEWCHDVFQSYGSAAVSDPAGPENGTLRVIRGGTFRDSAGSLCAGARHHAVATEAASGVGFRVARNIP